MRIVDLLPAAPIPHEHADTLLELAYLMTAADGRFADEERRAYEQLFARVRGVPPNGADVDALAQRFMRNVEARTAEERIRAIAPTLPADLREAAFKIAIGLALADRDASPREDALMNVFFEALGLDAARAEALAAEARGSFTG